jgi:hypothetical protein
MKKLLLAAMLMAATSSNARECCPCPTDPKVDACPYEYGIKWDGKKRFLYGMNYAWNQYGGDFGGLAAWNWKGVTANYQAIDADFADMKAHGVNVVRWWMFPSLWGDGIRFNEAGTPLGLNAAIKEDLKTAIGLTEKHDMYIMLTLWSATSFSPTKVTSGAKHKSLYPIATDKKKTVSLINNVIAPIAKITEQSEFKKRVIAFDIINEPEWAMKGASKYGDPGFDCVAPYECLTHEQMESFVAAQIAAIRKHSNALITIGSSAIKWGKSWSKLDLDFYQFHYYDWVHQWYPFTRTPDKYGLNDKPVIIGEFPLSGVKDLPMADFIGGIRYLNYAGFLGWAVTDKNYDWPKDRATIKAFYEENKCQSQY